MDLLILLLVAAIVRMPFILQAGNLIDFDEATFALMAKRILEGELPIYISGHSYSGSFVSFLMAPNIALFGHTPFAVKLTALFLFLAFLAVNYELLKRIANQSVAVFASLFLILMPQGPFDVSLRVWGGHEELWVFQALTLFLLARYFDGPQKFFSGRLLLVLGLVMGTALWISEFFILFLIPFLAYFLLRFRKPQDESIFRWIWDFIRLSLFRLPKWLRTVLIAWHVLLGIMVLVHFAGVFLLSEHTEKFFKIFGAVPPFQIKTMKKLALIFGSEVVLVYLMHAQPFSKLLMLRNLGPLFGGLLLGYFPAILFNLAGGEGLRIFQKSGSLGWGELPARMSMLFTIKIPQFIFGLGDPSYLDPDKWVIMGCWMFGGIMMAALILTGIYYWKDLVALVWPRAGFKPSYVWIFYLVIILTLKANLMSTLEAARYLAPIYIALAAILGYFFGDVLWKKARAAAIFLSALMLLFLGYDLYRFYEGIPKVRQSSYRGMLEYLDSRQIRGGLASRTLSHILTYLSGEKIVFSTYLQQERYLPHEEYTNALKRKAYVFEGDDSTHEWFQKDESLFPNVKEKKEFGPNVVYLVEESDQPDPAYTPRPNPFPVHFYLNE